MSIGNENSSKQNGDGDPGALVALLILVTYLIFTSGCAKFSKEDKTGVMEPRVVFFNSVEYYCFDTKSATALFQEAERECQ